MNLIAAAIPSFTAQVSVAPPWGAAGGTAGTGQRPCSLVLLPPHGCSILSVPLPQSACGGGTVTRRQAVGNRALRPGLSLRRPCGAQVSGHTATNTLSPLSQHLRVGLCGEGGGASWGAANQLLPEAQVLACHSRCAQPSGTEDPRANPLSCYLCPLH